MPLDKQTIIYDISNLYLPSDQYCVLMGAALVLHGIKENANDVDLGCTAELFASLIEQGYSRCPSCSVHEKIALGKNIFVYKDWLPAESIFIDGIQTADLKSIIRDKKALGRQKDIEDIAKISCFMSRKYSMTTEYFQIHNQGRTLRGIFHVGTQDVPVLIAHGYFSSNKIGPHRLYVHIANTLSILGYKVLRIDLSGMGESDGDISDIDFHDHVSDIQCAATNLMNYCGTSKIHYIGHCVGSCTVLQSVFENSNIAKSMTLISPFMPSETNFINLLRGIASYRELITTGYTLRKGLVCRKSFIDAGYVINDYYKASRDSNIDSFVYFSSNDEMVNINDSLTWAKTNNVKNKIIEGADHNYINASAREKLLQDISVRFSYLAN